MTGSRAPQSLHERIDRLLTVDGVLGAVVVNRQGQTIAETGMGVNDAVTVSAVVTAIFGNLGGPDEAQARQRTYATFELQQGQIHLSGGRAVVLILLTEPHLAQELAKELIAETLAALEPASR